MKRLFLSIFCILIVVSCSPSFTSVPEVPMAVELSTATLTQIPSPSLPVSDGGTLSPSMAVISKDNLSQLTELAIWGKGIVREIKWSQDGKQFIIITSMGRYGYDSTSFQRLDEKDIQLIEDKPKKSLSMEDFDISKGYSVLISDAESGNLIGSFQIEGFSQYWPELHYLPESDIIVVDGIRNVQLRDGVSYEILSEFRGVTYIYDTAPDGSMSQREDYLSAVDVSGDRKMVATGQFDGKITLRSGEGFADSVTLETGGPVRFLSFSPDGMKLVSESNGNILVWDVMGASTIGTLSDTFISGDFFYDAYHIGTDARLGLAVKENTLAYVNKDNIILLNLLDGQQSGIINVKAGSLLDKQEDGKYGHPEYQPISDVFFSADGKTLITVLDDRSYVWDVSSRQFIKKVALVNKDTSLKLVSVYSAPDDLLLNGSQINNFIKIWNVEDGSSLTSIKAWNVSPYSGGYDGTHSLTLSPDGKFVFSWSGLEGIANLWEIQTQKRVMTIKIPASEYSMYKPGFFPVAISPDNKKILFTYSLNPDSRSATVYSIPDGKELYRISEYYATFSPDGSIIAASVGNNVIRFYDSETGKEIGEVNSKYQNKNGFQLLYFSEDRKSLIAVSTNSTIGVWGIP